MKYFDPVFNVNCVLQVQLSEEDLGKNVKMNLIFGIENGDGFQDGFEWVKGFGWPLRYIDHNCGMPKSPVNPASFLDY